VALPHSAAQLQTTEGREGEINGWGGWLPRGKTPGSLNNNRGMARARVDGDGVVAARRKSDECGKRETNGERVN
jgi:hypothetical protein